MKTIELESWALRILERVEKRLPIEDSRVELKAVWPDPAKTSRRLAGHANAARGETILWLIGADERQGIVAGADYQNLANWFPQVKACFESEVPSLQDLNVIFNGKTVAALCFDTSRFPFVVKNQKGGEIQFEVPWRDGTAVRSATRGDLVLMLSPLLKTPKVEILEGQINSSSSGGLPIMSFELKAYIVPRDAQLCFPVHRCVAEISADNIIVADSFPIILDSPTATIEREKLARNLVNSPQTNELLLSVPEKIAVRGLNTAAPRFAQQDEFQLKVTLIEAFSEAAVVLSGNFRKIKDQHSVNQPNRWGLTNA